MTTISYEHPGVWNVALMAMEGSIRYKNVLKRTEDTLPPVWGAITYLILDLQALPSLAGKLLMHYE